MTAYAFVFLALDTGRVRGQALVCPAARYASIAWTGAARLDRRHTSVYVWRRLERELFDGFSVGPVSEATAVAQLLTLDSAAVLQFLHSVSIAEEPPDQIAARLDGWLRGMAA